MSLDDELFGALLDSPDESQSAPPPVPVGAGGADHQPRGQVPAAQRDGIMYGPAFVRFVTDQFALVHQVMGHLLAKSTGKTVTGQRFIASGQTNGSGNAKLIIFDVNPGQKFSLHRMYVHAGGYTWIAPWTGAGEVLILIDGVPWDGGGLNTGQDPGQLPAVFSAGWDDGVEAQDGERIELQINAGPANTQIVARCMGHLADVRGNDD